MISAENKLTEASDAAEQSVPPAPVATGPATTPPPPSGRFMTFLLSGSGTALITVLLGTIGGGLITQLVQWHLKDRETRSLAFAEYLKNEERVSNDAFVMIGKASAAAEDMAVITEKQFYTGVRDNLTDSDRKTLEKQKSEIATNFNMVDAEWRRSRDTLGLFMRLYHRNDPDVAKAWDRTATALTSYIDCERSFNLDHSQTDRTVAQTACGDEGKELHNAESYLAVALANAQAYSW
jgi:hypothetical protein